MIYGSYGSLNPFDNQLLALTFTMFEQTGNPGYYMFYSDLLNIGKEETKGDQTLE